MIVMRRLAWTLYLGFLMMRSSLQRKQYARGFFMDVCGTISQLQRTPQYGNVLCSSGFQALAPCPHSRCICFASAIQYLS